MGTFVKLLAKSALDLRVLDEVNKDEEGIELSSIAEVRDEAAYALADLFRLSSAQALADWPKVRRCSSR